MSDFSRWERDEMEDMKGILQRRGKSQAWKDEYSRALFEQWVETLSPIKARQMMLSVEAAVRRDDAIHAQVLAMDLK